MSDLPEQLPNDLPSELQVRWGEITLEVLENNIIYVYFGNESVSTDLSEAIDPFYQGALSISYQAGDQQSALENTMNVIDKTLARGDIDDMNGIEVQMAIRDTLRKAELEVDSSGIDHYMDRQGEM